MSKMSSEPSDALDNGKHGLYLVRQSWGSFSTQTGPAAAAANPPLRRTTRPEPSRPLHRDSLLR